MNNEQAQAERIVKAHHVAEFVASDLRETHAKADDAAEEMMLMGMLSDANKMVDKLKRLAGAKGGEWLEAGG